MAATDHHGSHGGGDHRPATGQLSPNEHRQHAEPDEHGGHGGHAGHGGHGDHAAMFRDRFWLSLVLTVPVVLYSARWSRSGRLHAAPFPGSQVGRAGAGNGGVLLRRLAVPDRGGVAELRVPPAGHDAADLPGHHGRLRRQLAPPCSARSTWSSGGSWPLLIVGHAARPLAGDAGHRPGLRRAGRPGRAPARRGRAWSPRRRPETVPVADLAAGDVVLVRPGRPGPGRRRGRRRARPSWTSR